MHNKSIIYQQQPVQILDDIIIGGVVTADDKMVTFTKQFVMQDSTEQCQTLVSKSGLYADYPIGRRCM